MNADTLKRRKEVLHEIDKLLLLCKCNNNNSKKTTCSHCRKIEQYGKILLGLLNNRNKGLLDDVVLFDSEEDKTAFKNKAKITVDEYYYYKSFDMWDKDIAKKIGVSSPTLITWKKENNVKKIRSK